MIKLQDLWNDSNLPFQLNVKLVKSWYRVHLYMEQKLVYGAEAWTLCKADENRIIATEMWFWRRLLKVPMQVY